MAGASGLGSSRSGVSVSLSRISGSSARPGVVRMSRTAAIVAPLGSALALMLGGCTSGLASTTYEGIPDGAVYGENSGDMLDGVRVGWLDDGALIALTTYGSSSCPVPPDALAVSEPDALTITLGSSFGLFCTADMHATTYEIPTPTEVDTFSQVQVDVDGLALELPPIRGE